MKSLTILFVVIVLLLIGITVLKAKAQRSAGSAEPLKKKRLLTERETAMQSRLVQALPDAYVFPQVSFGALVTAKTRAARNSFDRKIADFVICDRSFHVLAVVELDDGTHKGRETHDRARDQLLISAGYRVLRYPLVPDIDKVRADLYPKPVE